MVNAKELQDIANLLRRDVLQMTTAAGSGHATSALSSAELITCLFFHEMSYDKDNANNHDNDEFVLSKGHAAPILYAALSRAKCIQEDIMEYRKISSSLEGHPIPSAALPWIKAATGSLGQGLGIGIGMALAAKMQKKHYRTYVLLGDSECSEGSVWEAIQLASYYKLNNLCAIVDVNKLGQRGETMLSHNIAEYKKRFESFGWKAITINGHKISNIISALENAKKSNYPTAIIARTIKGKGVSFLEGRNGWHGKALKEDELEKALKEIPNPIMPNFEIKKPKESRKTEPRTKKPIIKNYNIGELIATREAYGTALAYLAYSNPSIISLDGEVSNSTFAEKVKEQAPNQFIECFIAEQNMISMALGLEKKGYLPFVSTFAAFLTRAHDQIRMSSISHSNMTICGSHAGVSIGEDGASQMGLEDIALFRSLPNSIVLYPCDAVSAQKLVNLASQTQGIKYIRTTRPKTPVIYNEKEEFILGDFKVLKFSNFDSVILAGSGITLHECLKAHDKLKSSGLHTAVIDIYCIKPFNAGKFIDFVKKHGNTIIVAEDHYPEGGIGEMLASLLANHNIKIKSLAVNKVPHSGTSQQLLEKYNINSDAIVKAARAIHK